MARALLRGLSLIEGLAETGEPIGVTDLAAAINLDKGTTFRLLQALLASEYVSRDKSGKYSLTGKLLRLANGLATQLDLRYVSRPHLIRLRDAVNETVHLGVLESDRVSYVDKLEPAQSLVLVTAVGQTMPVHSTALGKAITAAMDSEQRAGIIARLKLIRQTGKTITSRADLLSELRATAERGYAIDNEENYDAATCVAAPILGPKGTVLGAVSISSPTFRIATRIAELGDKVRATATAISRDAGARIEDSSTFQFTARGDLGRSKGERVMTGIGRIASPIQVSRRRT